MTSEDRPVSLNIGCSPFFWVVILALSVMFCGEPDLHDALVNRVAGCPTQHPDD